MITYTAPSAITAGTLIRQNTANIGGSAFTEDLDFSSYNFNHLNYIYALNSLNTGHDGILVFQGSASDPRFIWAYHTGQWGKGSYADYYWSNLPTGLTNGTNAVYFPDNSSWSDVTVDDGYYSGDKTAADAATWRLRVANSANWTTSSSTTTVPALLYSAGASYIVTAAPTVTTQAVSAIGSTSAIGNGNISDIGGVNVTERGVYWSTTDGFANGTGTKVSTTGNWSVTGDFTQPITGLTPNITYYVKAFATNSVGTSYGEQVSFATGIGTDVNNASLNALSIYPNPAVNGFTVNVGEKTSIVSIYDTSGCLVLTQQANKETYIEISSLQRGVYLVKANEWVGKLVKK